MTSVLQIKRSVHYVPLSQSLTHTHESVVSKCLIMVLAMRQISGFCQLTLDPWPQHNMVWVMSVHVCVWVGTRTAGRALSLFSSCSLSSYHIPEPWPPFSSFISMRIAPHLCLASVWLIIFHSTLYLKATLIIITHFYPKLQQSSLAWLFIQTFIKTSGRGCCHRPSRGISKVAVPFVT